MRDIVLGTEDRSGVNVLKLETICKRGNAMLVSEEADIACLMASFKPLLDNEVLNSYCHAADVETDIR